MAEDDVEETFENFWKDIIEPDGVLDLDQVKRELHDYKMLLDEVPKVYGEITGGRISKPNTLAFHVLSAHEDVCHEFCGDEDGESLFSTSPDGF